MSTRSCSIIIPNLPIGVTHFANPVSIGISFRKVEIREISHFSNNKKSKSCQRDEKSRGSTPETPTHLDNVAGAEAARTSECLKNMGEG